MYEFGGGKVKEHLGGIYDFLREKKISELNELGQIGPTSPAGNKTVPSTSESPADQSATISKALSYAERKEQLKQKNRAEKAVKASEAKIEKMEARLKELDELLMIPENASDMTLVTEYTSTKKCLDEEVEKWEQLSEELETITQNIESR